MSAQNDAAFLRMALVVLGALVAFAIIILIIAGMVTDDLEEKRGSDSRLRAQIEERIKPVGQVEVADVNAAPAAPKSGKEVVTSACNSCHGTGVLGAPKVGDTAAWQARMNAEGGVDGLVKSAIAGKGAMPPRGGAADLSDDELKAGVVAMLEDSGVSTSAGATAVVETVKSAVDSVATSEPVQAAREAAGSMMDAAASMASAMMPGAAPAADLAKGKDVYATACFACHGTGAAGAPKVGDKAVWAPRLAKGDDALTTNAIRGVGAMPAKGGRMDIADADIAAAVAYMLSQSR